MIANRKASVAKVKAQASEAGLTKNRIIAELTRSPHGDLDQYLPVGLQAAREDAEFFAHLIAWNDVNGQVRDAKVALPVVQLATMRAEYLSNGQREFKENALAHLARLDPRNLVRASKFAKGKTGAHGIADVVKRYLREREKRWAWWERTALAHRRSMRELYKFFRVKPSTKANQVLFLKQYPADSLFGVLQLVGRAVVAGRHSEAAELIVAGKLPYLAVLGVLGGKPDPAVGMALIERMSPTDLVTNTKMLERLGVQTNAAMRAAYEAKLAQVAKSKKNTLKAAKAADVVGGKLGEKLRGAQEKAIDNLGQVKGRWLVLGDKSGSMQQAIETSRVVAATLARVAEEVHLVFFDTSPRYIDATDKDYDKLLKETAAITANGGTSIGCGLAYIRERAIEIDGIAIVSDGAENNAPLFAREYDTYAAQFGKQVPVYLYRCRGEQSWMGDLADTMKKAGHDMHEFDLRGGVDAYSLPNLIATMRSNRYSLVDEIMQTPLITLDSVFANVG